MSRKSSASNASSFSSISSTSSKKGKKRTDWTKRELLALSKTKLVKECKRHRVADNGKKSDMADRILKKINKKKKVKSPSPPRRLPVLQLPQSNTGLAALHESKENENENGTDSPFPNKSPRMNTNHTRSQSIVFYINVESPKKEYLINNVYSWNTIKDIKERLPIGKAMERRNECFKLFHRGYELNDNQTLYELNIVNPNVSKKRTIIKLKIKLKISFKYFKPNPNTPHPSKMEHDHYDKVREIKIINDAHKFDLFITGYMNKNNIDIELQISDKEMKQMIWQYSICLSGNRTFERKWTELHSMCYDYPNNIEMVVDLLKTHNLYIDAWPHCGYDTPLRLAINNANPRRPPKDKDEEIRNKRNAENAIELVEFLVINGARRRIGLTLTNLERKGKDDKVYQYMDKRIRERLIEILKPYEAEDPWKPPNK